LYLLLLMVTKLQEIKAMSIKDLKQIVENFLVVQLIKFLEVFYASITFQIPRIENTEIRPYCFKTT